MIEIAVILLLAYFYYASVYNFTFSLAGVFYRSPRYKKTDDLRSFVVFIPAYKEDQVIVEVAKQALDQDYPQDKYDVVVIADQLQPETMEKLNALPIIVVEVFLETSTKVKALNIAFKELEKTYDHAVIIDADNVMEQSFITKMNMLHQSGHKSIQGRRAAKNDNNLLSYLDGLSEEINNHVLGKGSNALGMSSALKGSGMSFIFSEVRDLLASMESVGGFDRELELRYQLKGQKVTYAGDVIVYDEKTTRDEAFTNQRRRWIASQFHYLFKYFSSGFGKLFRGNLSYFNSAILRNMQLPRLINLGLSTVLFIGFVSLEYFEVYSPLYSLHWTIVFGLMILSLILSIPRSYYTWRLVRAFFMVPKIFLKMFLLLFKLKGANKKFIHTPHSGDNETSNE